MKRTAWLLLSMLMVATLLMVSCQPAAQEGTEGKTVTGKVIEKEAPEAEEKETAADKEAVPTKTGPQYGGTITFAVGTDQLGFDETLGTNPWAGYSLQLTNEELLQANWALGQGGTGEYTFTQNAMPSVSGWTGCLAESWELTGPDTITFKIRKGVRWQDKPPVNGRELTADDVVFSIQKNFETPTAYLAKTYKEGDRPISVTAPDKYTVVMECPSGQAGGLLEASAEICRIIAPEVYEQYGNMKDWRNVVGTGPFTIVDYIPDSSTTLKKNPNYWGYDPFNPANKLPYADQVVMLVIKDASTRLAALRTAKIDRLSGVSWEDRDGMLESNPDLQETRILAGSPYLIFMRTDTEPFDDIRVRRALAMGVNQQAIVDDYYGGNAEIQSFPVAILAEYSSMYTPVDELKEETRKLFEYHPDEARQLLAEAGYPNGFSTSLVVYSTPSLMDLFAIVKDDWSKIGVDLTLDTKEYAVWMSMCNSHTHTQMITRYMSAVIPEKMYSVRTGTTQNMSIVADDYVEDMYVKITAEYFNPEVRNPWIKEVSEYVLDQCWMIQMPAVYSYCMWQPWLKGYHGETAVGRNNLEVWPKYAWVDAALKAEMKK